LLITNSQASRY